MLPSWSFCRKGTFVWCSHILQSEWEAAYNSWRDNGQGKCCDASHCSRWGGHVRSFREMYDRWCFFRGCPKTKCLSVGVQLSQPFLEGVVLPLHNWEGETDEVLVKERAPGSVDPTLTSAAGHTPHEHPNSFCLLCPGHMPLWPNVQAEYPNSFCLLWDAKKKVIL